MDETRPAPYEAVMLTPAPISVAIRSYGLAEGMDRHDFAQLVLPLEGSLSIGIEGQEALLGRCLAAYVAPGAWHTQGSALLNRSLIIDLPMGSTDRRITNQLAARRLIPLSPAATSLIDYIGHSLVRSGGDLPRTRLWTPLLLDALTDDAPALVSRLTDLLDDLEATPFADWTTTCMAARAGVSISRLHALFREELGSTPRAWLAKLRLDRITDWLIHSDLSLAEIAFRGRYADQSALTRAMRKATGLTPGAYRRQARETRSKLRES